MLWVFWRGHYHVAVYHWVPVRARERKRKPDTVAHRGPPRGLLAAPDTNIVHTIHIRSIGKKIFK